MESTKNLSPVLAENFLEFSINRDIRQILEMNLLEYLCSPLECSSWNLRFACGASAIPYNMSGEREREW